MTAGTQPDLTISSGALTATPSTVAQGGSVQLSAWTVRNQGSAASGGFSNGFYLSSDPVITSSDTYLTGNSNNSLAPGTSFNWGGPTLTIPAATTPGTFYIGILVDNANAVAESSETNNYVSTAITVTSDNALPSITSLSPPSRAAGGPAFTLTVVGSGFVSTSRVRCNGSDRATTFVSAEQLKADILASDIASAGPATITVFNPSPGAGLSSPSRTFRILPTVRLTPSISSLSPSSIEAGSSGFELTVNGSNFVKDAVAESRVRFNNQERPTTFLSSAQLRVTLSDNDIARGGTINITVSNEAGGVASNPQSFAITNPRPSVCCLDPISAVAGRGPFTLIVYGSSFVPTSVVQWNGSNRDTRFIDSAELRAAIPAGDIAQLAQPTSLSLTPHQVAAPRALETSKLSPSQLGPLRSSTSTRLR